VLKKGNREGSRARSRDLSDGGHCRNVLGKDLPNGVLVDVLLLNDCGFECAYLSIRIMVRLEADAYGRRIESGSAP
jgi:hypothetical protein